jgi:hypothetical protein
MQRLLPIVKTQSPRAFDPLPTVVADSKKQTFNLEVTDFARFFAQGRCWPLG